MNIAIAAEMLLILTCFLATINYAMTTTSDPFKLPLRKAREVYPSSRRSDYVAIIDIKAARFPIAYSGKTEYLLDDHNPAAKWVGRIETEEGIHLITILAHQLNAGEPPMWTVIAHFTDMENPVSMQMVITTPQMHPKMFSDLFPKLEQRIFEQGQRWKPRGF